MHTESQLRRRVRREGLSLIKYRENSRWYAQYGPYALADRANVLVAHGMTLDDLVQQLG